VQALKASFGPLSLKREKRVRARARARGVGKMEEPKSMFLTRTIAHNQRSYLPLTLELMWKMEGRDQLSGASHVFLVRYE